MGVDPEDYDNDDDDDVVSSDVNKTRISRARP